MNFFGIGPLEFLVILVVALVFVGPERLPRLAADIARTIGELRKYTGSIAAEFNEVVQEFEKETEGERSEWKEIGEGLTGATRSVADALRGARTDAEGAPGAAASQPAPMPSANGVDGGPHAGAWHDIPEPDTQEQEPAAAAPQTPSAVDEPRA